MDKPKKSTERDPAPIMSIQLGVWRVLMEMEKRSLVNIPLTKWNNIIAAVPLITRFLSEIYLLGPGLFTLMILAKFWGGIESVLLLYASSQLLTMIEVGIIKGQPDAKAILSAVATRILCVMAAAAIKWWCGRVRPVFQSRVQFHFEEYLLRENLRIDLPTSETNSSKTRASAAKAWKAFDGLADFSALVVQIAIQLTFISRQDSGGPLFTLLCMVKPFLSTAIGQTLWMKAHVLYSDNVHYIRLRSLRQLADKYYREDIISGNVAGYIVEEYRKARKSLGDTSDDHAEYQYRQRSTPLLDMARSMAGDVPMVYCAAKTIIQPAHLSVTSIAILQQYSTSLNYTLATILIDVFKLGEYWADIKDLYDVSNVDNKIGDGEMPYPNSSVDSGKGMSFDLQNVSFEYPGSKSKRNALEKVSFSIKAGQLVVIVGPNGSGKSTIIKLLSRMYDASSGQVLIDHQPIQRYKISDLREATATLTQNQHLYPLSLSENIGLGYPECAEDMAMVMESAKEGGASELIEKLSDGLGTILHPSKTAWGYNLDPKVHKSLEAELARLENTAEVSGGEQQRLVASRTFMRFRSGKVKFVAVDEPSSALDPEGEFQLFERLRSAGTGKTMIFVTHRFGHLTKFADLILCMKDGTIIESGTHKELLALDGEYSKMYTIQANAFVPDSNVDLPPE